MEPPIIPPPNLTSSSSIHVTIDNSTRIRRRNEMLVRVNQPEAIIQRGNEVLVRANLPEAIRIVELHTLRGMEMLYQRNREHIGPTEYLVIKHRDFWNAIYACDLATLLFLVKIGAVKVTGGDTLDSDSLPRMRLNSDEQEILMPDIWALRRLTMVIEPLLDLDINELAYAKQLINLIIAYIELFDNINRAEGLINREHPVLIGTTPFPQYLETYPLNDMVNIRRMIRDVGYLKISQLNYAHEFVKAILHGTISRLIRVLKTKTLIFSLIKHTKEGEKIINIPNPVNDVETLLNLFNILHVKTGEIKEDKIKAGWLGKLFTG